jgi:hypothetical protein
MTAKLLAMVLLLVAVPASSALNVFGQEMKYKVGDRVEVDSMMSSDPGNAKYKAGTIVAIDDARPYDKAYIVTLDESPNQKSRYIVRDYTKHWIRDIQGGDTAAKPDAKPDNAAPPNDAKPGDANQAALADAQPKGQKYKVGDRVEVDIIEAETPAMAQWKKGTITKVDPGVSSQAYTVRVDPLPGQVPGVEHVPFRDEDRWLRPLGGASPNIETDKLRADENQTVLADRELLDCKNLKRGPARNGQPPPTELIKSIIQCTIEKPSEVGSDGAQTMDIVQFVPGVAHRWIERVDSSIDATADTMVFPYHVKWNQKNFYRTYNQIETGKERNYSCYVTGNEWFCGTTAGGNKEGVVKRVQVEN